MTTTQQIIDQLNAYTGPDVWNGVILDLDEYDEAATAEIDPSSSGDRFALTDGAVIRWDPQTKSWYEQA